MGHEGRYPGVLPLCTTTEGNDALQGSWLCKTAENPHRKSRGDSLALMKLLGEIKPKHALQELFFFAALFTNIGIFSEPHFLR